MILLTVYTTSNSLHVIEFVRMYHATAWWSKWQSC